MFMAHDRSFQSAFSKACIGDPVINMVRYQVLTAASSKTTSSGMLRREVWQKFTDVSEVLTAFIMEAVGISEMTVNFHQTTRPNIP
jgi:hypothetical protein